jgi:hypothetical protein
MSFHYWTGEEVRIGDKVRTGNHKPGIVKMVIAPGSQASKDFSCPQGGVLIEEDWDGTPSLLLETPPDAQQWEDLDFIERG